MGDHAPKLHGGRQPEEQHPKRTRTRGKRSAEPTQTGVEEQSPAATSQSERAPEPEQTQGEI